MQKVINEDRFGVRPGTKIRVWKMTPEEEEAYRQECERLRRSAGAEE